MGDARRRREACDGVGGPAGQEGGGLIPLVAPTPARLADETDVRRYEEAFAETVGCTAAVAVCSGTAALELALRVLDIDRPSVPSLACSAIANAAADVTVVDGTFHVPTARMIQAAFSDVLVHGFGQSTTMMGRPTIEDWTLSLGGIPALLGHVGVCSTHWSKMITTGRGGIAFSNDPALIDAIRDLAYYDQQPNGLLGSHSLGMTSMQAALGLSQLAQLDSFIERRRYVAGYYSARFESAGIECPDHDCGSVFYRYLIGVDDPAAKIAALAEHSIEAGRGVYPPLHQQLGMSDEQFPGATACVNRLLSVPCHPSLTDKEVWYVGDKVLEVCA